MDEKLTAEGLTIAPGVIETIISLAVAQVEGVAQVGSPSLSGSFMSAFSKRSPAQGVLIAAEEGNFIVTVHVQLFYGYKLHEVAEQIRHSVAATLEGQVGITISTVDVYVDGIQFPE
jgi:uncharacterized alkaline shock family protein YloU